MGLCYNNPGNQYMKVITDQQESPRGMRQEALLTLAGKLSLLMASTVEQGSLTAALSEWLTRLSLWSSVLAMLCLLF